MALINATNVTRIQAFSGLGGSKPTTDFLNLAIPAVSALIEQFLRRHLKTEARTEDYDVEPRSKVIYLQGWPVESSPAPQLFSDVNREFGAGTEVDADEYVIDLQDGVIDFVRGINSVYVRGRRVLRVTYTGGMAIDSDTLIANFPTVAFAADLAVMHYFERRNTISGQQISLQGQSVTLRELRLPMASIELLAPFRRSIYY